MSWTRRTADLLVAAVMVMPVAACTTGGGGGETSCAAQYTYQGSTYRDVANVKFTVGKKLGVVTSPSCDDTGGSDEDKEPVGAGTNAYEMDGISPEVAIAVGDTPETTTFFAVYDGSELPPAVQKLVDGS
ncbi:DUF6281 family protein [Streptomyces sp. NPDC060184]|uniref:DUF6281 family protein n=1 Tax=Streptomyces sp. NPDC060184 TaxID=3347064 RepID=UPI003669CB61